MFDENEYTYIPENQPCEWHMPAHDALAAAYAEPPLAQETGSPLGAADLIRLGFLAHICVEAFALERRPRWNTVRELAVLALKVAQEVQR